MGYEKVGDIFQNARLDSDQLSRLAEQVDPRSRYLIAFTPRSGSSYLGDVMGLTKRFGQPGEFLNEQFLPHILLKIPGRTPAEYLRNTMRARKTPNGVSGLKASWFQFRNFISCMEDREYLTGFRCIYLTRRDLAAQAVSLYKATESSVFHTNIQHDDIAERKLHSLEYDYARIHEWYSHIRRQEKGWQQYFYRSRIFPLHITYEEIEEDILGVLKRIATYVAVEPNNVSMPTRSSVFKKMRDRRNVDWAHRFEMEREASMRHAGAGPSAPILERKKRYWPFKSGG